MSEPLVGVVVCHASLAEGLVRAVESIAGVKGALEPVSNTGCDRGLLAGRIEAALEGRPGVVFVDMPSGSCLVAALQRVREEGAATVVTGVNLAMLLDFVFHRELSPAEAADRALNVGQRAIRVPG